MKHLVLTNAHFIYWNLQFDEWIKTIGYGNGKETAYASNIKEFLHFLETNNISSVKDVNQHHIGQYYQYISNRPKLRTKGILSASSINHQMLALRLFFDYLLDCKEIDYSPARIPKFRISGHNPRNIVNVDKIKLIYKKAKTLQNKAIISCAYGCGLRRNEMVNLNVSDIDLKNKTLLVRVAKGGKTRLIPLSDKVALHFKKYLKFHQNNFEQTNFKQLPLFICSNGSRMRGSKINQTLKTIILNTNNHELIGKNITLHCLRHSIAVHLINNGAAITFVQTYLGHSSIDTTNLYAIKRKRKSAILRAFRYKMEQLTLKAYLRLQKHTQNSVKSYLFIINRYLNQNPDAWQYDYKAIMDYFKQRLLNNRSGIILLQAGIKKYYDYLLHIGLIYHHPCRTICIKKKSKNIVHSDLFSAQELSLLLKREERYAVLKYRNKLVISLLIYQGLTLSEITQLKLTDLNLDEASIRIKGSVTINRRILNLKPNQIVLLDKYMRLSRPKLQRGETKFLLLNKLGNPIKADDVQYLVETFRYLFPDRKLNIQTIRQSVIANWLNTYQIPVEDVQLLAGHKRPSATLKYQLPDMEQAIHTLNTFFPI